MLDCAGKHQVLIFVHSRKETAKTALYLKQTALDNDHLAKFMRDDSASREILQVRGRGAGEACRRGLSASCSVELRQGSSFIAVACDSQPRCDR